MNVLKLMAIMGLSSMIFLGKAQAGSARCDCYIEKSKGYFVSTFHSNVTGPGKPKKCENRCRDSLSYLDSDFKEVPGAHWDFLSSLRNQLNRNLNHFYDNSQKKSVKDVLCKDQNTISFKSYVFAGVNSERKGKIFFNENLCEYFD